MIAVWVDFASYQLYMNGEVIIAWNEKSTKQSIQLVLPLNEITNYHDWGSEGIEFNFKRGE